MLSEINSIDTVIDQYRLSNPEDLDIVILGDFNADCSYATSQELWESPLEPNYPGLSTILQILPCLHRLCV